MHAWEEFASVIKAIPPRPETHPALRREPVLTNPELPVMANVICVYAIALSPAICLLNGINHFVFTYQAGPQAAATAVEDLVYAAQWGVSLFSTATFFIGGLLLRARRRAGRRMIIGGIVISAMTRIFCSGFGWAMDATLGDRLQQEPPLTPSPLGVLAWTTIAIALLEGLFLITAWIWLAGNGNRCVAPEP
jgi:hypothetical protein